MKQNVNHLFLLLLSLVVASCVEVIDWEGSDESSGRLVVEGLITSENTVHQVKLSRTQPVIVDSMPEMVSGALVEIHEGNILFPLSEISPGVYQTDTLMGKVGATYQLVITVGQDTYEAVAQMPPAQPMEPLEIIPWDEQFQSPDGADYFQFIFRENFGAIVPNLYQVQGSIPEDVADYYPPDWEMPEWIRYRFESGNLVTVDSGYYLHPGLEPPALFAYGETNVSGITYGTIIVEKFYSMTDHHYAFVRALMSETEWQGLGPFSYISADVPTNISNGALGYFAASEVLKIEQVVL
ncbi:MAG: hypothetical protein DHS20C17_17990 [Cyclobacteriaceae bacterium]|nr:MAG: hypothetical protein DHS20C17_17990 [Cyclobacteriaceae bacterium]